MSVLQVRRVRSINWVDTVSLLITLVFSLLIIIPFINVIAISFSTQQGYFANRFMLFPTQFTTKNFQELLKDGRIWVGYRTSLTLVLVGVPLNMLLTILLAYGTSRPAYPGKKVFFWMILFTMLFSGGIVPLYLQLREMGLTNTIWAVLLTGTVNTFYMIIMRNYFLSLPESLIESVKLDGAGEWTALIFIIIPLSKPILATMALFYMVDRWNEWYSAMIFIRKAELTTLQLVLRSIVIESQRVSTIESGESLSIMQKFEMGIKMGAIVVTILPVMCVFPFLQKYFTSGIMIGAIKT